MVTVQSMEDGYNKTIKESEDISMKKMSHKLFLQLQPPTEEDDRSSARRIRNSVK